ncbi:DUF4011 domain-containing protein [Brevibacterium daeguense]|nr:DUF3320 domain-containing protein [Brevibacterium daeguense]
MRDVRVLLLVQSRYWRNFRYPTKPSQTAWANELLGTLNRVAHVPHEITFVDLITFLGIAQKLLVSLNADPGILGGLQQQTHEAMRDSLQHDGVLPIAEAPLPPATQEPPNPGTPGPAATATPALVQAASLTPPPVPPEVAADTEDLPPAPAPEPSEPSGPESATNRKNDLAGTEAKDEEARLIELFFPRIPGSDVGLDDEFIAFRDLRMAVFYRKDLNFALAHNRVSVFAGIGVVAGAADSDGADNETAVHEITGLTARLGSLKNDESAGWTGPNIELNHGESWWAEPADLNWALPHGHFIGVDEATADTLELEFDYDGVRIQRSIPLRILAHDQWTPATVPEIVAAFVRPRAEAVGRVLSKTSDLLAERTGDPSLVGYQDSPERVLETARAIYDAVRSFDIRYSEPPASFETDGQKIRTSDVVLKERFGTCLDTAVLFAAVLEEAGIQPYIVLLKGHAVVGFTLKEIVTEMVIADSDQLSNLFGSDFFIPIETTLCVAGRDASFEDAVSSAFSTCKNGRAVQLAVNVQAAHRRIKPLPTVVDMGGERTIVVVENRAGSERGLPGASATSTDGAGPTVQLTGSSYPYRVQRWRSDLLDLSFRNPLLKLSDSRGIKFLVPGDDLGELENRLAENQSVQLTPHENVEHLDLEQGVQTASQYDDVTLSRLFQEEGRTYVSAQRGRTINKLTSLRRDAKSIKEDTGATALFVSLGLLKWKSAGRRSKAQEGRSPLFLLPVELTGSTTRPYSIRMEPNAEVQPNYCLIEKLRQEYNLTLPQLESPPADESGIDLPRVFRELRELFLERGLDFAVEDRAHLAILQFASLDMWRDVGDNWKALTASPVVDHFVHHPSELFRDSVEPAAVKPADEVDTFLPLPADGSQLAAVKAASAGCSFVLEGPPGTGKSQTITNMIADGIAQGRTILFVAEKQAALTVVHDRLKNVGLEPLVLNVHGKDQSINLVRDQIKKSLLASAKGNASVFDTLRNQLRHHIEDLESYPTVIHDGADGQSVWDRYQRCLLLERNYPADAGWTPEEITVTPEVLNLDQDDIRRLAQAVNLAARRARGQRLSQEWTFIGPHAEAPSGENDTGAILGVAATIAEAAHRLAAALAEVPQPLAELLDRLDARQQGALDAWLEDLPTNQAVLPRDLDAPRLTPVVLNQRVNELQRFRQRWMGEHAGFGPAAADADTAALQAEYEEAQRAGILQRRRLTKLALSKITAVATPQAVAAVEQDPLRFLASLRAFQQEHAETRARLAEGLPELARLPLFSDEAVRLLMHEEQRARNWEGHAAITRALLAAVPEAGPIVDAMVRQDPRAAQQGRFGTAVQQFRTAWDELRQAAGATDASVTAWLQNRTLVARIRECAAEWNRVAADRSAQADFMRQVELQRVLSELAEKGLAAEAEVIQHGHATDHLAEAIELAAERERLEIQLRGSDLDIFDSRKRGAQVREYVRLSRELKRQLWSELPARLLAERGERPNVSVGLRKEIDRKRGGSIRRLFENYGEEILGLTPVILMSPSSVARFLPVNSIRFDTVIFDEASQVKVADAVGSLGRANSAVIVGDSKQMPPTNVFGTASTSEDDEDVDATNAAELVSSMRGKPEGQGDGSDQGRGASAVGDLAGGDGVGGRPDGASAAGEQGKDQGFALAAADQESILSEAVGSGLEQRWLSWHYRSKHESLISFSNVKYYNGNLQVFPGPPEAREGLGISVKHVGGRFDRGKTRTNEDEARAIVAEITERLQANPMASIGVVTFNTQQRDLILDLLEQSESVEVRRSLERDDEAVFVKNLENVQGDERDVILFSIAFAKNPETGVLSHNFGPLNQSGGERRLNVAITRAREEVVLFSSIRSGDIDPAKTRAEGLLHLKEYLAYAEHGGLAGPGGALQFNADDLYREELAEALRTAGLEVVTDVGTSKFRVDLAVRAGDDYGWLAIVLDTPEWAKRQTTADRESLPSEILQGVMGWQDTVQVLLPAWIQGREVIVEDIVARAEALAPGSADVVGDEEPGEHRGDKLEDCPGREPGESTGTGAESLFSEEPWDEDVDPVLELEFSGDFTEPAGAEGHREDALSGGAGRETAQELDPLAPMRSAVQVEETAAMPRELDVSGEYPFVEASDEQIGEPDVLDGLSDRHNKVLVQEQLTEIIETEGPIEAQRLARVLGSRFGFSRMSKPRAVQILGSSPIKPEKNRKFGDFYWPSGIVPGEYTGYRSRYDAELTLSVNEISHRELANAMAAVLHDSDPLPEEALLRETMGVFGWSRMGRQIRERLEDVADWAVKEGRFEKDPNGDYRADGDYGGVEAEAGVPEVAVVEDTGTDTDQRARTPHEAFASGHFGAWVLTCNPSVFDPRDLVETDYSEGGWTVNPRATSRTALMEPGQRVLMWMTNGSDEFPRGFWGAGSLTSSVFADAADYSQGWLVERDREQEMFIEFEMDMFREPVRAEQLVADELLAGIEPLQAPQVTPAFLTLAELEHLNQLMEVSYEKLLVDPLPQNWRKIEKHEAPHFEHRRRTEMIAMDIVTQHYESLGYEARDVSRDRVGWDISFVTESGARKNVEVKGLSRSQPVVSLTRNELRKAGSNPHWELAIITDAHSDVRRTARFFSREAVRAARSEKRFRHQSKALVLDFSSVEPDLEIRL